MPKLGGIRAARVAGLGIAVMFMGSTLLTPIYALYQRKFGFSEITLTLVYAAYVVGNMSALFFFGRLSDQIGRRRTVLPAMALGAVAMLVFLFAPATPWLFVARILSGLAIGTASAAATAWVAELIGADDNARASALATTANMWGVAAGPLLAGVLAQYAPGPLRTSYVVYLVLLGLVAWRVLELPETLQDPVRRWRDVSFRPRLGVPPAVRLQFIAPAVAAFAVFALGGYYAALVPTLLSRSLGIASPMIAGAVVAELYLVAATAVMATHRLSSRTAMLAGLGVLLPSVGLLLLAQMAESMPALLLGTALGGIALALAYRGSLQVINGIAPEDQRAEVVASYLIVSFLGNSLPVIGVGVLSRVASPATAHGVFAIVIAVLAVIAMATGWTLRRGTVDAVR
jgi:MFS transporter